LVSSLLQRTLSSQEAMSIVPLAYFCSQHRDYHRDIAASPVELVLNILLQLIRRYPSFPPTVLQECPEKQILTTSTTYAPVSAAQ
jgi:hypothetical protein